MPGADLWRSRRAGWRVIAVELGQQRLGAHPLNDGVVLTEVYYRRYGIGQTKSRAKPECRMPHRGTPIFRRAPIWKFHKQEDVSKNCTFAIRDTGKSFLVRTGRRIWQSCRQSCRLLRLQNVGGIRRRRIQKLPSCMAGPAVHPMAGKVERDNTLRTDGTYKAYKAGGCDWRLAAGM